MILKDKIEVEEFFNKKKKKKSGDINEYGEAAFNTLYE